MKIITRIIGTLPALVFLAMPAQAPDQVTLLAGGTGAGGTGMVAEAAGETAEYVP